MKFLLDSNAFFWWIEEPHSLSTASYAAIENADNIVYVSAITFLELGIKESLGKLSSSKPFDESCAECNFIHLPLTAEHGYAVRKLPLHHRDPFDRALIAQASIEGLTLITRDRMFTHYHIPVLIA